MTTQPTTGHSRVPSDVDELDDLSIIYPSSDGEPMAESDWQYVPLTETVSTLRVWFQDRPDVYVAGDMLVYYRMNDNLTRVAPDVYAVFGVSGNHRRDSWIVWREGKAPDFVLEIASPSTWQRDVTEKRSIYADMGVTEYWRFDPTGDCFIPALVAERLVEGDYTLMSLTEDSEGVISCHSEVLGLDICVLPSLEFRLYDPATGLRLRNHREDAAASQAAEASLQAAEAARQAAEAARQAAEAARQAAEAENRDLRERLRALEPDSK